MKTFCLHAFLVLGLFYRAFAALRGSFKPFNQSYFCKYSASEQLAYPTNANWLCLHDSLELKNIYTTSHCLHYNATNQCQNCDAGYGFNASSAACISAFLTFHHCEVMIHDKQVRKCVKCKYSYNELTTPAHQIYSDIDFGLHRGK